jgi:hypothetical protein
MKLILAFILPVFILLDEEEEWLEPRPKSILKKRQGSTDDELEDSRPKSILKSRLSPPPPSLKSRHGGALYR